MESKIRSLNYSIVDYFKKLQQDFKHKVDNIIKSKTYIPCFKNMTDRFLLNRCMFNLLRLL